MGEEYEPTLWEKIEPNLNGIAILLMNAGLAVAGLATLYLLYNLLSGGVSGFNALTAEQKAHVLQLIAVAGKALYWGAIAAGVGAGFAYRTEESTGYALLGGAAALGLGIPFAVRSFAGIQTDNVAGGAALTTFVRADLVPGIIGAILVVRDIILRVISAIGDKSVDQKKLTYGSGAQAEKLPARTSLMAKCWEGGFCREFIRPHCPIFIARKACWQEKRGCYCEEDIVSAAAAKVQGVVLDMAPDPKYNFANAALPLHQSSAAAATTFRKPVLSAAQKRERCRNCVIYNEHEKEKYRLLLPVTFIGGIVLCAVFATPMRMLVDSSLSMTQKIVNQASFAGSGPQLVHPGDTVEWFFVGAFALILISKLIQLLEWACFKAKI